MNESMKYKSNPSPSTNSQGFSIVELIVVVAMMGIFSVSGITSLKALDNPVQDGASTTVGFLKQVKARAISTTSAYQIIALTDDRLITQYANTCSAGTFTIDPVLSLDLPKGANFQSTAWTICFSARGFADANQNIVIEDGASNSKMVEIFLGGGARII